MVYVGARGQAEIVRIASVPGHEAPVLEAPHRGADRLERQASFAGAHGFRLYTRWAKTGFISPRRC